MLPMEGPVHQRPRHHDDFRKSDSAVLDFVRGYADPGVRKRLPDKPHRIQYQYDWNLNDRPGVKGAGKRGLGLLPPKEGEGVAEGSR